MKNLLKYLLLILFISVFSYVLLENWILSKVLLYTSTIVLAAILFFILRKYIEPWPFHKFLLVFTFLFLIYSPMVGRKETDSLEKRKLAQFPKFRLGNIWKFLHEYDDYFTDRFAFRNKMLELNGSLKLHVWNTSPVPEKVEIGSDKWLFSSGASYVQVTSVPFTDKELRLIETNLELVTRWLKQRNINYYFVCAPVKGRIYPEKLPAGLKKRIEFSKLDQLYNFLKRNTAIRIIDMRNSLIEGRKVRDTYIKTDTHWNSYGAYLGYRDIMQTLQKVFPQLKIHQPEAFRIDSANNEGGDLLMFMGLKTGIPFYNYNLVFKSGIEPEVVDSTTVPGFTSTSVIRQMPDSVNGLQLFVVRDSYTVYLKYYLSASFDKTYYAWTTDVPLISIMHVKPDIVLHEMLEMFINHTVKLPPEIKSDTLFMKTYAPAYDELLKGIDISRLTAI